MFLHVWVGEKIATEATPIGRVLLLAFWANAFALLPFTKLQASGRPDLVTKILLLEIPFYFAALYFGITHYGLMGCAAAFAGRCIVDCTLLSLGARRPQREFVMLALNGAILGAAIVATTVWRIDEFQWWLSATVLLGILLRLDWAFLPTVARVQITSLAQRVTQRA